jgi:hypothetical protein
MLVKTSDSDSDSNSDKVYAAIVNYLSSGRAIAAVDHRN